MFSAKLIWFLPRLLGLSLCLQGLSKVTALKGDTWCGVLMCATATVNNGTNTLTYELKALNQLGWMAIGFGSRMWKTPLVIMWPNADGSITLSQRNSTGLIEPTPVASPDRVARVIPTQADWSRDTSPVLSFEIPADNDTIQQLVWAFGTTRPPDSDPTSNIEQHLDAGRFSLNLTKDVHESLTTTPTASTNPTISALLPAQTLVPTFGPLTRHEKLIVVHGVLVTFGFLFLIPAGALMARWGRVFTPHWLKIHWVLNMILGGPITIIGWTLAPLAVADQGSSHFRDVHEICGVLLLALYILQLFLSRYTQSNTSLPKIRAHPPRNVIHILFGLVIIGLALFQTRSGLSEWTDATGRPLALIFLVVWTIWVVLLPLLYCLGFLLLRRQLIQEHLGMTTLPTRYTLFCNLPPTMPLEDSTPRMSLRIIVPPSDDGTHDIYSEVARDSQGAHHTDTPSRANIPMREMPTIMPITIQLN